MNSRQSWIDIGLGALAGALLMALMLLTFADVLARYVFNAPISGAFELTELSLLVLIFAGLPLASRADEHVTMDFIDKVLSPGAQVLVQRVVHFFCGLLLLGLSYLVYLKAGKIMDYGDTTDILKVPVGPFVYVMAVMVLLTGVIHLVKAFGKIQLSTQAFDPNKSATT